ncbi:uncharacterized protein LOC124440335 isoform X2 [Xenia sp. Carnegie-2017]|uniref:uncharacterized protein LOC124440335 isoform X2 n=1 Tax=Xenia sp. Carnegie-2017 TaxID=2897299 RepID=UPI001F0415CA|nr:uncharacterized protein LOC124440335 isoform X2 [Xenia sp. Carnegie-2017]
MRQKSKDSWNDKKAQIRSKKHMANVRRVSHTKNIIKVTAEVNISQYSYTEKKEQKMKHFTSSPVASSKTSEPSDHKHSFATDNIRKRTSLQLTPGHLNERRNSNYTPGHFVVSATSLIMAGSPYMESTFLKGSRSMEDVFLGKQEFSFENLVFEGGGSKGIAYVGALQVLEEVGILKNIKRFAGASVGAMVASLVAIRVSPEELQQFLCQDVGKVLSDHSCGYCSLLPNLRKGFGWNSGKKLNHWFGEQLKERTGDSNITFKEVFRLFGTEICIVVTNLNHMSVEYFHPKTTPNVPLRKAVKMSMALPGVYQVVRETFNGQEDVYVDGGLLCNYPIHVFDGWWLSMESQDAFFKRLISIHDFERLYEKSERFGTWNEKTLGIILYSNSETELMKTTLSDRPGNKPPSPPDTKLAKQRYKLKRKQQKTKFEHEHMVHIVDRFMKELEINNLNEDSLINLQKFSTVFKKPVNLHPNDLMQLFGDDCDAKQAFSEVDNDNDGEELMAFVAKKGVNLKKRFLGYTRKEIKNLPDFLQTLQTALQVNAKRVFVEKRDVYRSIGIDTDYVEANDFNLENEDKVFLIESGRIAARAYLHEYIKRQNAECEVSSPTVEAYPQLLQTRSKEFISSKETWSRSSTSSYKSLSPVLTPVHME